ncbi:MAG TPA: hypothetical protein VNE62_11265, partial [Actinomycetota bacterium]|nr:hypothetical protein [Actinomycetota bacterium]
AVDGGSGCVDPSDQTIEAGKYTPLSRPLYIYASKASVAKPHVRQFVEFYLDSVGDVIGDVGYVSMPKEKAEDARNIFKEATKSA